MLFNSALFAFFVVAVLVLFALLRRTSWRKGMLLVASYAFYAGWDWRYLSLLWISTAIDYWVGRRVGASARPRLWLLLSVVTNLGLLGVFKYGNFVLESLPLSWSWSGGEPPRLPTQIPVGISFYTFQTLSYTIDCYRRRIEPCRRLVDFALFVAFFPQLVAGPIVRSHEFLPQLRRLDDLRLERVASGFQRFLLGLFKKVVIADNVALFVDGVFAAPDEYGAPVLWLAAYGFALQIYTDFSAYTDMALGVGRALGIALPENFAAPYLARSITEFWRRWHQSLSSWLRDYLYIPLGGNRVSPARTYVNLMLTMLLGGLWHGAAWTFVLWGGLHGLWLAGERWRGTRPEPDVGRNWSLAGVLRLFVTFHLVCVAWVIFRAPSFPELGRYLGRMLTAWSADARGLELGLGWAAVLALLCAAQFLIEAAPRFTRDLWRRTPALVQGAALAALVLLISLWHTQDAAFLYFQF